MTGYQLLHGPPAPAIRWGRGHLGGFHEGVDEFQAQFDHGCRGGRRGGDGLGHAAQSGERRPVAAPPARQRRLRPAVWRLEQRPWRLRRSWWLERPWRRLWPWRLVRRQQYLVLQRAGLLLRPAAAGLLPAAAGLLRAAAGLLPGAVRVQP